MSYNYTFDYTMNFDKEEIKDLLVKYRESRLTLAELEHVKTWINTASVAEIENMLDGENPDEDVTGVTSETLIKMKAGIDSQLRADSKRRRPRLNIWKAVSAASAAVIALLVWIADDIHSENARLQGNIGTTVITTGIGEKSTVTLPDGTVVTMNSMSKLTFNSDLNSGERKVDFNGEAYFAVAKDSSRPFEINTGDMIVEVHGTSFSLLARHTAKCCELMLDNGSVRLVSSKTNRDVRLEPGEMALYNKAEGDFIVESFAKVPSEKSDKDRNANELADTAIAANTSVIPVVIPEWRFSGVEFDNVSPDSLVRAVEMMYGVKLNPMIANTIDDNFTGSLPDDDLYASLRILSRVYGFEMPFTVRSSTPDSIMQTKSHF